MKRLISVDVLRAVAILLMIQVHFVDNLSPRELSSANLHDWAGTFGSLPAPIFTFLVGLSLWLWLEKQERRHTPNIRKIVIRRGLLIFTVGLAFATFIWSPKEVFSWDILTLIGAATLILFTLRRWSPRTIWALAVLILLVSPFLRDAFGYYSHWRGGEYHYHFTMSDVLLGFFLQGYFPIFPWLIFPLLGFATGKYFFNTDYPARLQTLTMPAVGAGLLVLAAAGHTLYLTGTPRFYADDVQSFYPASTTFVLGTLGLIFLSLWGLHRWLDMRRIAPAGKVIRFFQRYSRFSLTAYIAHHAAHVYPLYFFAWIGNHHDQWYYYADAVSTPTALWLTLIFVVLFYGVLIKLEKHPKYSFEWILRWLSE